MALKGLDITRPEVDFRLQKVGVQLHLVKLVEYLQLFEQVYLHHLYLLKLPCRGLVQLLSLFRGHHLLQVIVVLHPEQLVVKYRLLLLHQRQKVLRLAVVLAQLV